MSDKNYTLEIIMYVINSVIVSLMISFSFVNPSLLQNQYWTYILITLITAIVFHTGTKVGKNAG